MDYVLHRIEHLFSLPLAEIIPIFALLLLSTLLGPIVSRRFKLPAIVGLILLGLTIGPHGLALIQDTKSFDIFGTIGLLYIMFMAGLELDINQFQVHRNKSIVFAILTYVGPFIVIFPLVHFLYDLPWLESFLFATMLGTHTLIAYPVVSRLGVSRDPAVAITVGGTILVDTAILIALAIILGLHAGDLSSGFWLQLILSILAFVLVMHFGIGKLGTWFFKNFDSEKHLQYSFVIFAIFVSALLAELAGLEAIVGAFSAGLVLNRLIPRSSNMMHHIEFFGNALFIPLFLLSVGMLVNLKILMSGFEIIILSVVLAVGAIVGKWLAALWTQKLFKLSTTQRRVIFGLSSAHVAATLAVVLVGYRAGLISEMFLNATIVLILITCIFASFVTEKAAKQLAIEIERTSPGEQDKSAGAHEHILLPIANVNNIGRLFDFAQFIKNDKSTNPITVLTVVPNDNEAEENIRLHRKKLDEYLKHAKNPDSQVNVMATIDPSVSQGIMRASREIMADLVVLGWPKPGLVERIIGEKWASIINQVDKMIFLAYLRGQSCDSKRIVLLTPPQAELERGFEIWLRKVVRLANEWSLSVEHFGDENMASSLQNILNKHKLNAQIKSNTFHDWDDFLVLSRHIKDDDLIIFISARKNTLSYLPFFENMPSKLEKYFEKNNKVIIFPKQNTYNTADEPNDV